MDSPLVEEVWLRIAGRPVACHVLELGLACCGVEVREARRSAAVRGLLAGAGWSGGGPGPAPEGPRGRVAGTGEPVTSPREGLMVQDVAGLDVAGGDVPEETLHVLVVAGTVTVQLAPLLVAAHRLVPEPRAVLAFGACAATGGPYWDSYSVLPGAHEVVAVDAWVAGCPPRPADLIAGLEEVVHGRA